MKGFHDLRVGLTRLIKNSSGSSDARSQLRTAPNENPEGHFEKEVLLPALPSIGNVSKDRFREPDDELPQLTVLAFKTGERLLQLRVLEAIGTLFLAKVRFHLSPFKSQHTFNARKIGRSKFGKCT